ncbi:MAG TPA: hypothetical protein VGH42_12155 [Verrucomicrobiae bacterium]|jgi:hypothetical protein
MSDFYILVLTPFALIFALVLLAFHFWHHPQRGTMKSIAELILFVCLFLLGAFEIFYGALVGPACIIAQERLLREDSHSLALTDDQVHAVVQHFGELHAPWSIVTYFGVVTIIIGITFLMLERKRVKKSRNA